MGERTRPLSDACLQATGLPRPRVLARYSSTLFEDDHGLPTDLASSSHSIKPLGAKRPGGAPDHKPGPPGMYGAIAALATDFGRGRVLLCSCHPEFTPGESGGVGVGGVAQLSL